MSDRNY
ncbi:hypothetical protein HaLaN_27868 [Haematococcus lacustris]|nr:hypothetical protein HaLaN_27868 [Haematococcus lacustris]